jgi:hypothetical protein
MELSDNKVYSVQTLLDFVFPSFLEILDCHLCKNPRGISSDVRTGVLFIEASLKFVFNVPVARNVG